MGSQWREMLERDLFVVDRDILHTLGWSVQVIRLCVYGLPIMTSQFVLRLNYGAKESALVPSTLVKAQNKLRGHDRKSVNA